MKVTQIVKDAIKTRVKKLAEPKIKALQKKLDELHEEQNEHFDDIKKEVRKSLTPRLENVLKDIIKKHSELTLSWSRYSYSGPDVLVTTPSKVAECVCECMSLGFIRYKQAEEDKLTAQIKDLNEKVDKNISDIILELELGGNKATLDDLLKKVQF